MKDIQDPSRRRFLIYLGTLPEKGFREVLKLIIKGVTTSGKYKWSQTIKNGRTSW